MNNEAKDTQRFNALLVEAGILAERINLDRFQETVPNADHTTRLCFILDVLLDIQSQTSEDLTEPVDEIDLALALLCAHHDKEDI